MIINKHRSEQPTRKPNVGRIVEDREPERVAVSFEFFPPKDINSAQQLWRSIRRLEVLRPRFVSVTYGAGGSSQERTLTTVRRLVRESALTPAAHLTCVGATKPQVDALIRTYKALGVGHIVALRGDPPSGAGMAYAPHPGGYENAAALVGGIAAIGGFDVSVAAYPEKHPESPDWQYEMDNLKRKADAGATRALTQFFFDNNVFDDYRERVARAGIAMPIVPGIIPMLNFAQTAAFAERCGARIPKSLAARYEGLEDDPVTRELVAATTVAEQVMDLVNRGVTAFHFYTMNRADLVYAICHILGLRAGTGTPPIWSQHPGSRQNEKIQRL